MKPLHTVVVTVVVGVLCLGLSSPLTAQQVPNYIAFFAGPGIGFSLQDGIPALDATIFVYSVFVDTKGNVYFTDKNPFGNHRIRVVGPDCIIRTFAGSTYGFGGDGGPATLAKLSSPQGMAMDTKGNFYIADLLNRRVRRVDPNGIITTFAGTGTPGFSGDGGPATQAQLVQPFDVAADAAGNVYIADNSPGLIRRVDPNGIITTFAGGGNTSAVNIPAIQASLSNPIGVSVDPNGMVYIVDLSKGYIFRVGPDGILRLFAGGGNSFADGIPATQAQLGGPWDIDFDAAGNAYIAEEAGRIRRVDINGIITTFAGGGSNIPDGVPATQASLLKPIDVAVGPNGAVYIPENNRGTVDHVGPMGADCVRPSFAFDKPLPDPTAHLCLPPFMVQDPKRIHFWWAKETGGVPLGVSLTAISVNPDETGSATVKLRGTLPQTIAYPAGSGTEASTPVRSFGALPGTLDRIDVTVTPPASGPPARHYRLDLTGVSLLGTESPMQAQAENNDARWGVIVQSGEGLDVAVQPGPEAGATVGTGTVQVFNPSNVLVATAPLGTPISVPATHPSWAAGIWTVAVSGADHHYIIDKTSGADHAIYVTWMTYGFGTISGVIRRGGVSNTVPVTVEIKDNLTGAVVKTLPNVTSSYSANKVPVGDYTIQVTTPPAPAPAARKLTCGVQVVANFDLPTVAPTQTAVVSSPNPSSFGGSVTSTATVTSGGSPVTQGTVTFKEGSTILTELVALNLSGQASFTTSALSAGSHTITAEYSGSGSFTSSSGNVTQNVVDTKPPVITLNGDNPMTLECPTAYAEPGATAKDDSDPNPTLTITGSVDTHTPGSYTITYTATDKSGNSSTATRTVKVVDTTKPVITLNGDNPMTLECPAPYTEPGATAKDDCDPKPKLEITGTVDSHTPGTYTITYKATDASGNSSTATRTVKVVDTTKPVITLNGDNPMTLECPAPYTEPGATAKDDCDPKPTLTITGTVDSHTPGTYTITYTATDASGNSSTATRTVKVVDTTKPVITLNGDNPMTLECPAPYTEPGATAKDDCDPKPTLTITGTVDSHTPGSYTITYKATDASGNSSTATRTVKVVDTKPPTITLKGANPITIECPTEYVEPGATTTDVCDPNPSLSITGTVDSHTPGSYTITYKATDASGNSSTATRTVKVQDTKPPVITLNGDNPITLECPAPYTEPGATAKDDCDPKPTLTITGSVDTHTPGSYTITYTATDKSGNSSSTTRTVKVVDTTKPVITLNGDNPMTLECPAPYTEPGATAKDDCDPKPTLTITGTVDSHTPGSYTITYKATDASGNSSSTTRTVKMVDTKPPTITLKGDNPITLECPAEYVEPGAIVTDDCDPKPALTITGIVDSHAPGTYTITYEAKDASGNKTLTTRKVIVQDITPPTITLNGDNPLQLTRPTTYTEPGAVVKDACDPSPVLTISGTVNTSIPGTYTVTYTAKDASGNKTVVTRTVEVLNRHPTCDKAVPSIAQIWPPDHKMVDIKILNVTDPDGDPVTITVTKITQDEPLNTLGDGNFQPDGGGIGTSTAQVRAERSGTPKVPGNGRCYHITFTASDPFPSNNGTCEGVVMVCVPHDQAHPAIDDGPKYNSVTGAPAAAKPVAGLAKRSDVAQASSLTPEETIPEAFGLDQSYPNPFNPSMTIRYALPQAADVHLVIYNVLGQQVKTLVHAAQGPGYHTVVWDGRDEAGRVAATGLYIYRLQAGSFVQVRKMLMAK